MASANLQSRISLDATKFQAGLRAAGASAKKFSSRVASGVGGAAKSLLSMTGKVTGLGAAIGALGGAASVFKTLAGSIREAANMEQLLTSFEVLLGSGEKAVSMLGEIEQFADSTPFQMENLAKGAQTLLAFGTNAEEIMPILKQLGDVSGGNNQRFDSLTLAFGQMSSAGKLMGQDLLQMINVGFNPLQEISKRTGESMASLKDRMSKGAISVEEVKTSFAAATSEGGQFFGMLEKQSQTTTGLFSTLLGAWKKFQRALGEPINDAIGPWLKVLTTKLVEAQGFAVKIGEVMAVGIGKAIESINTGYKYVSDLVKFVDEAFAENKIGEILEATFKYVGGVMVNAFAGGITYLKDAWVGVVKYMAEYLTKMFLEGGFIPIISKFSKGMLEALAGLGDIVRGQLGGAFNSVVSTFQAGLTVAVEKVIEMMTKIPFLGKKLGLGEDYKARTFDEAKADFSKLNESDALIKKGKERLAQSLKDTGGAVKDYHNIVMAAAGDVKLPEFKQGSVIDTAGLKSTLEKVVAGVAENIEKTGDLIQKGGETAGKGIGEGGETAGKGIGKGGETAGKGIGEGGSKAGKEIGLAGNVAGEAVKEAGQKILSAAEIAVLQARSGTELRKKTSDPRGHQRQRSNFPKKRFERSSLFCQKYA